MEVCTNENGNCAVASEDLSWALQIGDLDTVKEQLQRLAKENGVIIFSFCSELGFIS
jgi:hypothetical protein